MQDEHFEPLQFDGNLAERIAQEIGSEAFNLGLLLITEIWWPLGQPFAYDTASLAGKLAQFGVVSSDLERVRSAASRLFSVLPDGRWEPSPELFKISDG